MGLAKSPLRPKTGGFAIFLYVHSRSQNIGVARLYALLYVHLEMHSQIREKYVVHLYVRMLLCLYVHMY